MREPESAERSDPGLRGLASALRECLVWAWWSLVWELRRPRCVMTNRTTLTERLRSDLWRCKPIRCCHCRGWFMRGDFLNPFPNERDGGLACSYRCCYDANPPQGKTFEEWLAEFR